MISCIYFYIFALLKAFRKILSLFLIGVILSFSGGLHLGKHLCNGDVVARAINYEVSVCKKAKEAALLIPAEPSVSEKSCCDTDLDFFHTHAFSAEFSFFAFYLLAKAIRFPQPETTNTLSAQPEVLVCENLKGPPLFKLIEHYLI